MKKNLIAAMALLCASSGVGYSQENQIRRLPEVYSDSQTLNPSQKRYHEYDKGFWYAVEASGAYSCRLLNSNFGFAELDATAGYRFNEYLRVGAGFGGRFYFDNDRVRYGSEKWAFPLYLNVRGNFIPTCERDFVPYYSFDLGGTIRDGFMMRPTIGVRIGQKRSAMLLGLSYVGQDLTSFRFNDEGRKIKKNRFVSFISLRVGYEF